jgi:hypothetical protein
MHNVTKINIELKDSGGKSAIIKVIGERNNTVFFDEIFQVSDEQIYPLRLHILSEKQDKEDFDVAKGLTVPVLRKLLADINKRSKRSFVEITSVW